jgi:hypothetical protein
MIKLFAAALAFSYLSIRELSAQAPGGGVLPTDEKTLQMVIDSGVDQPILCESHEGIPEPVVLVAGQPAEITLRFPANTAGGLITVSPLDGGQIDLDEGVAIPADGSVTFHYQPDALPGLYRIAIDGAQQYQISFYVVDPNRRRVSPPGAQ